jgi:sugar (pentulose or hexulose) kinase
MAAACNAPVTVMKTAGEGGPYGMALLAAFRAKGEGEKLESFLENKVFAGAEAMSLEPDSSDVSGFNKYLENFKAVLKAERAAVENY